MKVAASSDAARMPSSFSPSAGGEMLSMSPRKRPANSDAVNGTSAVEATSVTSTSVASRPISAASAGAAIIGDAMP